MSVFGGKEISEFMGLKILHVASCMPGWGGTEKHIMDISPILARRGHRVTIGCQAGSEIERKSLDMGLPTVHLRIRKRQDWSQFPQFVRAMEGQYDIVHIHHPIDYIVPAAAARFARVPAVVMSRHNPNTFRNILVAYACSKLFYDGIIAVSEFIRGMLITDHVSPDRIVVVRNGIEMEPWLHGADSRVREEIGIPASAFVVAAAGRFISGKGLDVLVRAVAAARQKGVDVSCMIAGDGDGRAKMEQLIQELDLQSSVRLLGFRRDMPAIFGAADVVAVPSVSLESFSYTTLEGMASGRPVIGSRIGGIPELITEDVGRLTTPHDFEGIAAAIVELAGDDEKRTQMGRNAALRAKQFTLDACVEGIERVYATLLQSSPRIASETTGARTVL
jgi:glycosyltransferase involved in cell wall biosynthesis